MPANASPIPKPLSMPACIPDGTMGWLYLPTPPPPNTPPLGRPGMTPLLTWSSLPPAPLGGKVHGPPGPHLRPNPSCWLTHSASQQKYTKKKKKKKKKEKETRNRAQRDLLVSSPYASTRQLAPRMHCALGARPTHVPPLPLTLPVAFWLTWFNLVKPTYI